MLSSIAATLKAQSQRNTLRYATRAPLRWAIYIACAKLQWLGEVEAASEKEAIAKGAEEFKQPKERLMAVRRG
jgi:hypothetical protein